MAGQLALWVLLLALLTLGCEGPSVGGLCVPGVDCVAISSIEPPPGCATCDDCGDRWGSCAAGGLACKRGLLDLDREVDGCESPSADAPGDRVVHSDGETLATSTFNGSALALPIIVTTLAYSPDDPDCVPSFSLSCTYTLHALQLQLADFEIVDGSWSEGVATLNGPVAAADDGTGIRAVAPLLFAFAVRKDRAHRIALSTAEVSIALVAERVWLDAARIDFGGYQIRDLFFDGALVAE